MKAGSTLPKTGVRSPRRWRVLGGLVTLALVPLVGHGAVTYDRARVTDVEPIYELVSRSVPVEQCHEERIAAPRYRQASATGPLLGAIIGGAIGNAVGHKKRNKQVGTLVGAVLGGSIGADITRDHSRRHGRRYTVQEVCDTHYEVHQEEQLAGYRVSYVYGGSSYTTRMSRDPGETIRVRVRVSPAE